MEQALAKRQETQITNYDKIKALADNRDTIIRFTNMLGSRYLAQSYIASAMLAVANSKDLMECSPSSIFNSTMRAAALRLYCDPALKQAHLVPFWDSKAGHKNATMIIGYVGLNNLALRTGKYQFLNANAIYEGQTLEIDQLTGDAKITGAIKSRTAIGYFHYFRLKDGFSHAYYMAIEELRAHGEKYAPKNPLWKSKFEDMARKTVTRMNLLKFGILNPNDRDILDGIEGVDGEIVGGIDAEFTETDDLTAEEDAEKKKEAEANAPTRSQEEILKELGLGASPAPIPQEPLPMELERAKSVVNSKGKKYADMTAEELDKADTEIEKRLTQNHLSETDRTDYLFRRDAIKTIRASQKPAQEAMI